MTTEQRVSLNKATDIMDAVCDLSTAVTKMQVYGCIECDDDIAAVLARLTSHALGIADQYISLALEQDKQ